MKKALFVLMVAAAAFVGCAQQQPATEQLPAPEAQQEPSVSTTTAPAAPEAPATK